MWIEHRTSQHSHSVHPYLLAPTVVKSQLTHKALEHLSWQGLGQSISYHVLTGHKVHLNLVPLVQVSDVVIGDIDVL